MDLSAATHFICAVTVLGTVGLLLHTVFTDLRAPHQSHHEPLGRVATGVLLALVLVPLVLQHTVVEAGIWHTMAHAHRRLAGIRDGADHLHLSNLHGPGYLYTVGWPARWFRGLLPVTTITSLYGALSTAFLFGFARTLQRPSVQTHRDRTWLTRAEVGGLVAAIVWASHPVVLRLFATATTYAPAITAWFGALWAWARWARAATDSPDASPSHRLLSLALALTAVAHLCRADMLLVASSSVLGMLVLFYPRSLRHVWRVGALMRIAAWALAVLPWVASLLTAGDQRTSTGLAVPINALGWTLAWTVLGLALATSAARWLSRWARTPHARPHALARVRTWLAGPRWPTVLGVVLLIDAARWMRGEVLFEESARLGLMWLPDFSTPWHQGFVLGGLACCVLSSARQTLWLAGHAIVLAALYWGASDSVSTATRAGLVPIAFAAFAASYLARALPPQQPRANLVAAAATILAITWATSHTTPWLSHRYPRQVELDLIDLARAHLRQSADATVFLLTPKDLPDALLTGPPDRFYNTTVRDGPLRYLGGHGADALDPHTPPTVQSHTTPSGPWGVASLRSLLEAPPTSAGGPVYFLKTLDCYRPPMDLQGEHWWRDGELQRIPAMPRQDAFRRPETQDAVLQANAAHAYENPYCAAASQRFRWESVEEFRPLGANLSARTQRMFAVNPTIGLYRLSTAPAQTPVEPP